MPVPRFIKSRIVFILSRIVLHSAIGIRLGVGAVVYTGIGDVPHHVEADRSGLTGFKRERNVKRCPRSSLFGRIFTKCSLFDIIPRHRDRVPPLAAEPTMVHYGRRIVGKDRKLTMFITRLVSGALHKDESVPNRLDRPLCLVVAMGEIITVVRKYSFHLFGRTVGKAVFKCSGRQSRIIFIGRNERTPGCDFRIQRHIVIRELDVRKRKRAVKRARSKRGKPHAGLLMPRVAPCRPYFFHSGTLPSITFEPFSWPLTCKAANISGSLKSSGT